MRPTAAPAVRLGRVPSLVARSLRLLWSAAPREFVTTAGLQVLGGLAAGGILLLVKKLLDAILSAGHTQDLGPVIGWLSLLGLLLLLTTFASQVQFEQQRLLSELVNRQVTWRVLEVAGSADLASFERPEFHDEIERAWQNTGLKPMQMTQSLIGLISSTGALASLLAATVAVVPALLPLLLVGAVPVVLLTARGSRALYEFSWSMTPLDRRRAYLSRVLTSREWIHEVIAYRLAGWLRGRWRALHDQRLAQMRELVRRRLVLALLSSLGVAFLAIGPIALLTILLATGHLQISQAVAGVAGIVFLRPALQGLTGSATQLYECGLFLDDYHRFAQAGAERRREPGGRPVESAFATLGVERVGFTYPTAGQPALRDISLEIRAGEVVALVGENGSGKTTLAKLLCGLYRPETGRILWDGRDTATMDPVALREHVAVVFQDFTHYFMTVRENVGVGRHERLDEGAPVEEAARRAGAAGFIDRLPQGYDTILGTEFERGHELSIGQWQRIALARAVFRQAPFVILDEPTAALDARAEHELFEAMRGLFGGRTVLLISHRFSSVRSADRIFVLDKGRVVETGSHDDLLRLGGLYAELFTLQAAAYLPDHAR